MHSAIQVTTSATGALVMKQGTAVSLEYLWILNTWVLKQQAELVLFIC